MPRTFFAAIGAALACLTLAACAFVVPPPAPAPDVRAEFAIPDVVAGQFNVAFVYASPIGDRGWTYAHDAGRRYLAAHLDGVHTAYVEAVPEDETAERVIRALARQGFDAVFATSYWYMDPTATVAAEFPERYFVHVSGYRHQAPNFANLFGALENAMYLGGMVAGARAAADGSYRVGYIAPHPIPRIVRYANALALGMRRTCAQCVMDVRWVNTWFDPAKEEAAARSLRAAGATVIASGVDAPALLRLAAQQGFYALADSSANACAIAPEACLGVPYWHWGPAYAQLVGAMMADAFVADDYYFDSDAGLVGFYGFMAGETPQPAVPAAVIPVVQEVAAQMQAGAFDRFRLFTGPLKDNQGHVVVPAGVALTQSDLEGIDAALGAALGRPACTICMDWLVEGFVPEAAVPE